MIEARTWFLEISDGPDSGRKFTLRPDHVFVIGRGSQSDSQIRDPSISRIHCEVRWNDGTPVIADVGGAGGTIVDGGLIDAPEPVSIGSCIQIGDTRLRVRSADTLDAATMVGAHANLQSATEEPPELSIAKIQQLEGHTFLRFELEKLIQISSSSVVFRGVDLKHDRKVAVKILRPNLVSTEVQRQRFIRAMRTMLPIKHPNIVRTRKAGRTGPYCWAAFDWIDGISVAELIETIGISGMLDWREVLRVAVHIGRALEEADKHGVVHRNVTPANLLRRNHDQAFLLTDLIYARALQYTDAPQLTRPGEVIGDLGYLAPERITDSTVVDQRSDQYSLGATLYALLTGVPPYQANSLAELLEKQQTEEPQHPTQFQMGLNENFCEVVMRMLSKSPESRYRSATKLLHELDTVAVAGGVEADWVSWQG
ncbi:Serine/threonine-protein kinase PknB [Rubripirellula amarantea]|uniref:Serine/threonine-protein kinase PknB n=1 Tax=Rubripirellula amarantea TaxID=2527999 RepID=A0A5C5WPA0_9BACT|nr:FHA domain-containing serine/threonine-protein kinase [Rubripirellula amarantea]TWT52397.1 Serine/threonine-protein kinase PknB [Rubripirellula amarantea]